MNYFFLSKTALFNGIQEDEIIDKQIRNIRSFLLFSFKSH